MADDRTVEDVFPLIKVTDNSDVLRQFLLRIIEVTGVTDKLTVPLDLIPPTKIEEQSTNLEKEITTMQRQIKDLEDYIEQIKPLIPVSTL